MSLRQHAEDYLALRRALGRKMAADGRDAARLRVVRLDDAGQPAVTVAAALEWATESSDASPGHWGHRLGIVRGFALPPHAHDGPGDGVPPADLIVEPQRRKRMPSIYSRRRLRPSSTRQARSPRRCQQPRQALVSLNASTGLWLGEALALDRGDVSTADATLGTVNGKNGSQRLVPLHLTIVIGLAAYAARRDSLLPVAAESPAFFITRTDAGPCRAGAQYAFARLLIQAGIGQPRGRRRPRIHDLRHTFAVTTLTRWYQGRHRRPGGDARPGPLTSATPAPSQRTGTSKPPPGSSPWPPPG